MIFITYSSNLRAQEHPPGTCCDHIVVNFNDTTDCCVVIDIYNPYCMARIIFKVFNPITQDYEIVDYDDTYNQNISFILCPEYGVDLFEIKVEFIDPGTNLYECTYAWYPTEGINSFSYLRDASQCCDCPPEISNDWLHLFVGHNPELCPDGCTVMHNLNIPEWITCFNYYTYDNPPQNIHGLEFHNLNDFPISNFDNCINPNEQSYAVISLMRFPDDPNPCILSRQAYCIVGIPDTIKPDLPKPCAGGCQEVKWKYDILIYQSGICAGCEIQAHLAFRECNGVQQLELLALVKRDYACQGCENDLFKREALRRIISENPMGFKPHFENECDTTWRVVLASCWAEYVRPDAVKIVNGDVVQVKAFSPCEGTECCTVGMRVCRYASPDRISVVPLNNQGSNSICSTLTKTVISPVGFGQPKYDTTTGTISYYTTLLLTCDDKCSDLFAIEDLDYRGKLANFDFEFNINHTFDDIEVSSIYKNEILLSQVICHTDCSDLTIGIYSIQGQLLIQQDYSVKKGINNLILYLNELNTGMFLIRYSSGGSYQSAEKLIIVK